MNEIRLNPRQRSSATPRFVRSVGVWLLFAFSVAGCAISRNSSVIENPVVEHYRKIAEEVAFEVDTEAETTPVPDMGKERELVPPSPEERRSITLVQAIQLAVMNNKILRQNSQFMSVQNPVLTNPDSVPSIYDPQIQNFGVLYGSRGTPAALSDFDPKLTNTFTAGRQVLGQNNILQPGSVLTNNVSESKIQIDQQLMTGGTVSLFQDWNYSQSNVYNQLFGATYTGSLGVNFQQPLWAAAGREVTMIAGPATQQARGFSYVNQGIVIARLNNRIAEIDFEENLQMVLREIGEMYWDLYEAFHEFEAENAAVQSTKKLWDNVKGKYETGIATEAEEAEAEDAFHEATARQHESLSKLLQAEVKMRRILGLPINDGKLLYPDDPPKKHCPEFDRTALLLDALSNRLELRRQKTNLKSLEFQLKAAKNLANPRLDLIGGYSLNGFGHHLMDGGPADGVTQEGFNNAYLSMMRSKETSWNVGLEYSVPIWLRTQKSQVHQLEFRLIKARLALATQEDEIARELVIVLQNLQRWHAAILTNERRFRAAQRRLSSSEREYLDADRTTIEPVIRAEISLKQAEVAYYRSFSEFNKALRELEYRTGKLSISDGIEILGPDGEILQSLESLPKAPAVVPENPSIFPSADVLFSLFQPLPVGGRAAFEESGFPPPVLDESARPSDFGPEFNAVPDSRTSSVDPDLTTRPSSGSPFNSRSADRQPIEGIQQTSESSVGLSGRWNSPRRRQ